MHITDLNGNNIEVTDLKEAIKQAAFFKDFCSDPPKPIADDKAAFYWKDLHEKLLALQKRNEPPTKK